MIPSIELINNGKHGRLLADYAFADSIRGYRVSYRADSFNADLYPDGRLVVYSGSEWDFGTFAIDDPAMVVASLEHDFFCLVTDKGLLSWNVRFKADKQLWKRLGQNGGKISRWWRTPFVMIYSQTIARWRRKK